jgi:hypothetical protein
MPRAAYTVGERRSVIDLTSTHADGDRRSPATIPTLTLLV